MVLFFRRGLVLVYFLCMGGGQEVKNAKEGEGGGG